MNKHSYYLGIDLHKKFSQVCVTDSDGNILENQKLDNTDKTLLPFFNRYKNQSQAVVEASPGRDLPNVILFVRK